MKRVRYVGVPDPWMTQRAEVRSLMAAGEMNVADLYDYNTKRLGGSLSLGFGPVVAALPGLTIRSLGKREGLGRTVKWGPKPDQFVQEISNADWEAIQKLPEASHFVLEDDPAEDRIPAGPQAPGWAAVFASGNPQGKDGYRPLVSPIPVRFEHEPTGTIHKLTADERAAYKDGLFDFASLATHEPAAGPGDKPDNPAED